MLWLARRRCDTVPQGTYVLDPWLSVLSMSSKAWLAAPGLLARAEVTIKHSIFLNGSKTLVPAGTSVVMCYHTALKIFGRIIS